MLVLAPRIRISSYLPTMSITYEAAAALRKAAQQNSKPRHALRPQSTITSESSASAQKTLDHGKRMPDPVSYEAVARPGAYYERPRIKRDLPAASAPWLPLLAFGVLGATSWALFLAYATNQERLSSSVVRQILQNLRASEMVRDALGEGVRPEPTWYLNGDPWIDGSINMLQGSVDISMRVKGSKGAGTLYFTSIRREKGQTFEILRFKIICDNGTVLNLPTGISAQ